jgi:hypothetical protein
MEESFSDFLKHKIDELQSRNSKLVIQVLKELEENGDAMTQRFSHTKKCIADRISKGRLYSDFSDKDKEALRALVCAYENSNLSIVQKGFLRFLEPSVLRQNIYELTQLEWMTKTSFPKLVKLPQGGKEALRFCEKGTVIKSCKDMKHASKSLDAMDPDSLTVFTLKYISDEGGAQDNQFGDVIHSISLFKMGMHTHSYNFCVVVDGPYFDRRNRLDKLHDLITTDEERSRILIQSCKNFTRSPPPHPKYEIKQALGAFFTSRAKIAIKGVIEEVLAQLTTPIETIVEPFAGGLDMVHAALPFLPECKEIKVFDIAPKTDTIVKKDTLKEPPISDYNSPNSLVITNPPFLASNKISFIECEATRTRLESLFKSNEGCNDTYKIFLKQLAMASPDSAIVIFPSGFFSSARKCDSLIRKNIVDTFEIVAINHFITPLFEDTTTEVFVMGLVKRKMPIPETKNVIAVKVKKIENLKSGATMTSSHVMMRLWRETGWAPFRRTKQPILTEKIRMRRAIGNEVPSGFVKTGLTLRSLDGTTPETLISLEYNPERFYLGKVSSRAYAAIVASRELSQEEQEKAVFHFKHEVKKLRNANALPHFREKGRRRISFKEAYRIIAEAIL